MGKNLVSRSLRLGSMLLDHAIMCFIIIPPYILFLKIYEYNHGITNTAANPIRTNVYLASILFMIYISKDIFGGRSIAKRIFKLQLVNNKTGKIASPLQSVIRNVLAFIWPVEVIISFFNTERRLGDVLAGTKITHIVYTEQQQMKPFQILFALLIGYITSYILIFVFNSL